LGRPRIPVADHELNSHPREEVVSRIGNGPVKVLGEETPLRRRVREMFFREKREWWGLL